MNRPSKNKNYSATAIFKRFWPFIKPYRFIVCLCIGISILDMLLNMAEAYFVKNLVNAALKFEHQDLNNNIKIMIGVVITGVFIIYFLKITYGYFSSGVLRDIRIYLVNHIQNQPVSTLENRHSGDLLSRMTSDISMLQGFINNDLLNIFLQFMLFTGSTAYMAMINWRLLLFSIMLTPPVLLALHIMNRGVRVRAKKALEYLGAAAAILKDTIGGIYMMKAFNIHAFLYEKYHKNVYGTLDMYLKNIRVNVWNSPLDVTLRLIPRVLCVTYGGYLVAHGRMTPGDLLSFIFLLGFVTWPLAFLPELINDTKVALGAFERLAEVMDLPGEPSGDNKIADISGDEMISFENLTFSYNTDATVLNNLKFTIKRGKKVALVGSSGSGKSTVFKLICGFYPSSSGRNDGSVKVYGRDIREWDINTLRAQFSLVSQDTYLFPTTIFENISYGNPRASREEIVAAAKTANAHSFINDLPDGYETLVGERGIRLSGGQRQRIAIARAVLKNAPILLLDEPTSALDTYSESLVQEALNQVMQDKTVLIVAHRLSTIKDVDEVLVMDEGTIVERGTHNELLRADGFYSQLYLRQFESGECVQTA